MARENYLHDFSNIIKCIQVTIRIALLQIESERIVIDKLGN